MKTLLTYQKKCFNFVSCQLKSEARIKAKADTRNALSMKSMALAFSEDKIDNPEMLFNWDATQFTIAYDQKEKKSTVVKAEMSNDNDIETPSSSLPTRP